MLSNGESSSGQGRELSGRLDNYLQEQMTITSLPTHDGISSKPLSLAVIPGEQNKPLPLPVYFCLWERNEERSPIGQMLVRLPQVLLGGLQIDTTTNCSCKEGSNSKFALLWAGVHSCWCGVWHRGQQSIRNGRNVWS